jgi:hypothetical protein
MPPRLRVGGPLGMALRGSIGVMSGIKGSSSRDSSYDERCHKR